MIISDNVVLVLAWIAGISAAIGILCLPLAASRAIVHHDFKLITLAMILLGFAISIVIGIFFLGAYEYGQQGW